MTDLEQLFQDAAALAEQREPRPADALGALQRTRAARRRRRTTTTIAAAAAVVVAAVAVAVGPTVLSRGGDSLVPADGVSSSPDTNLYQCTASDGASCVSVQAASPTTAPTTAAGGRCAYRPVPSDDEPGFQPTKIGGDVGLPPAVPDATPAAATIHTNRGDIALTLRAETACTVNSFAHLARHQYYDDTSCHRLTTEGIFVLQCGDPSGKGTGSPGYAYDDEQLDGSTYPAGTVAMANSGPNTNGSQFFLVYRDTVLDPHYTVFGHITAGLDVLQAIADGGSEPARDGTPKLRVRILSVTLD